MSCVSLIVPLQYIDRILAVIAQTGIAFMLHAQMSCDFLNVLFNLQNSHANRAQIITLCCALQLCISQSVFITRSILAEISTESRCLVT